MTPDEQLILELQKINKKLDAITNPFKSAAYHFSSGIWHSFGSLLGTAIITFAVIYIFSQLNITKTLSDYIKKLVPQPQINLTVPSSPLSPDQL